MQAQFYEFVIRAESSPSFRNDPSIKQTLAKIEETSQTVRSIFGQIQIFNHCYGVINEELRTYQTSTKDPRPQDAWLEAKLELIQQTLQRVKDNGSIARAFQQLGENLTSALRSGETSLNSASPLTDSLVKQLEIEKRSLDMTDFGANTAGEFNSYLPFFEKLRKISNDHPDLKEKNLTFIKVYTQTYHLITLSISEHSDHIWDTPRPRVVEEIRGMTKSLATVIDRTNPI
jgi:hypothetical protein